MGYRDRKQETGNRKQKNRTPTTPFPAGRAIDLLPSGED
jgi:hypothetical protein